MLHRLHLLHLLNMLLRILLAHWLTLRLHLLNWSLLLNGLCYLLWDLLRNLLLDMLMLSMIAHIFCWGRGDIVVLVGWLDGILVSQVLFHCSNWNQKRITIIL